MSIIGISPSDFALLAKAIYQIYNEYRKGPQRIHGILDGLRDLAANAEGLNSIFEVANTQDCPKYGGFDKLKTDLEEAQLFLLKCLRPAESTNALRRVVGATNLTISEANILEWQRRLAEHRARLESYKTSLIIRALYNNHRADAGSGGEEAQFDKLLEHLLLRVDQRMQAFGSPSSFRMTPRTDTFRSNTSTIVPSSPSAQRRYDEIAGRAQALHLHERDQTPHNNPHGWSQFLEKVAPLLSSQSKSEVSVGAWGDSVFTSANLTRCNVEHGGFVEYDSPSPQISSQSPAIAAELEGDMPTSPIQFAPFSIHLDGLLHPPLPPAPLILDDTISVPSPRQSLRFSGKVEIGSELIARVFGRTWIEVSLEISQVENVTYIWSISQEPLPSSGITRSSTRGLTPMDVLGEHSTAQRRQQTGQLMTFKHIIDNSSDSYPVVHHPGIEKERYNISFHRRQLFMVDGVSTRPDLVSKLSYRFASREDCNNMRANIFGKRLLASAGYENVRPDGACDFQTVSFWEDSVAGILLTLPSNARGGQCEPDRFVVFRVTGYAQLKQAKKNRGRLSLRLVPWPISDDLDQGPRRRVSIFSTDTNSANFVALSRRGSFPLETSRTCEILLSESSDVCKEDKRKLLRMLKQRFEPG